MGSVAALGRHILVGAQTAGRLIMAVLTSRSVVVVSTVCAVMYAGLWVTATLQANGLISTALPVAVSDRVVFLRGGGPMRQAALSPAELAKRGKALAGASTAAAAAGAQSSPMTFEVQTDAPVELWVTDQKGGEIGTNPKTGLVRLQIAGASYSGRGSHPQLISIPHASGQYQIQILGESNAGYQLAVRLFAGDDVDHATEYSSTGQVFEDTLLQTSAGVATDADGKPQLAVSPVQVVVAGAVPSPSPSPSNFASPSPSPEPSSAVAAVEVQRPRVVARPAAPAVVRPNPRPNLPIPLPVPALLPPVSSPKPNP
ncbi:MAG: hypothetical protein KGJ86_08330 [Chloroflexota bacterium]|nr:hypothetical protein [Chloroflexota bacterium]